MLPGALHGKGGRIAPWICQGEPKAGRGGRKKLGGQQRSGQSREGGNIKLMSTTGNCGEAPGKGRDIKLMPTTRPKGTQGGRNVP